MASITKPRTTGIVHKDTLLSDYLETSVMLNVRGDKETPPTGVMLPTFATIKGEQNIGYIGTSRAVPKGRYKKVGHEKVHLENQDSTPGTLDIDTVAYIDPAWVEGVYPQMTSLEGLAFEGDNDNQTVAGLTILHGGKYSLRNLSFSKVAIALYLNDVWLTDIINVRARGALYHRRGTSTTYLNCWAQSQDTTESGVGAFRINDLQYSSLIGCGSDGTSNGAFLLNRTQGVNLINCGCEFAKIVTPNRGSALSITDNNKSLSIYGFTCVPNEGQTEPLIAIGSNNNVLIQGFHASYGRNYATDIRLYGPDSKVVLVGGEFGPNGDRDPVIVAGASAIGSVVIHKKLDGTTVEYKCTAAGVVRKTVQPVVIASGIFGAGGEITLSNNLSISKTGTGQYTLSLTRPSLSMPIPTGNLVGNPEGYMHIKSITFGSISIETRDKAGSLADRGFSLTVMGS